MKILFQSIGILVHYNYALPAYITRMKEVEAIYNLSSVFPIFMGGLYYSNKSRGKLKINMIGTGINYIDSSSLISSLNEFFVKRIISKDYDVFHLNSNDKVANILLKYKVPKIFVLHGSPDNISEHGCRKLEDIYSNTDAFITVSFHAAHNLREKCGFEPTHIINHGVDVEVFNPLIYSKNQARKLLGFPKSKKIILWNARLSTEKKLETLLYALPYVLKEFKDVLVVVKTRTTVRDYETKMKKIMNRTNIDDYVLFDRSWTPLIKMPVYYRASDIYVNSSITEAFGSLTMLEAMACGVPTIANKASSNPEAIGDGGLLYNYNDPLDLAEKIVELLNDEKLMRTMSRKAVNRVAKELQLRDTAMNYLRVYANL